MPTTWTSLRRFLLIATMALGVVVMHAQLAPGASAPAAAMGMASTAMTTTAAPSEPGGAASHQHPQPAPDHSTHAGGVMCESGLPFSFVLIGAVGLLLFAVRRRRAGAAALRSWLVGRRSRWRWPAQLVDLDSLCVLRV